MQPAVFLGVGLGDHVHREVVFFVGPLVEFGFPGRLLLGSGGGAGVARCVADEGSAVESLEECFGGGAGIAVDADRDRLHETEHLVVGVDLNDLGVLGPIVHVVLRQGSERAEPGAEREHDIGPSR